MVININNPPVRIIPIGRMGENDFRALTIDVSVWLAEYPNGKISVIYRRPDGELYPVVVNATESPITWRPTATDTAVPGIGALEARVQVGDMLGKSCIIHTKALPALGAPGNIPPSPAPDWTQTVADDAARAEAAADKAESATVTPPYIGDNGNWYVWDADASAFTDTGVPAGGGPPDWSENDSTANGYIKNRTHYEAVEPAWVQLDDSYESFQDSHKDENGNELEAISRVDIEGVPYYNLTCTRVDNYYQEYATPDGKYRLCYYNWRPPYSVGVYRNDPYGSVPFCFYAKRFVNTVHKLDKKWLPDRVIIGPETAAVGQIPAVKAIDDQGNPTEWEAVDLPFGAFVVHLAMGDTGSVTADKTFDEVAAAVVSGQSAVAELDGIRIPLFKAGEQLIEFRIFDSGYNVTAVIQVDDTDLWSFQARSLRTAGSDRVGGVTAVKATSRDMAGAIEVRIDEETGRLYTPKIGAWDDGAGNIVLSQRWPVE